MYLLNGEQMKSVDFYSIETVGIPAVVLMERAALAVTKRIRELACGRKSTVLCVCGTGNNGADGMAAARQLLQAGFNTAVFCVGGAEQKGTPEYEIQKNILLHMGMDFRNNVRFDEYDFIVDAIFGIGLSREVSGAYASVIDELNAATRRNAALCVVAVDVPSGIHAGDGKIMAHAVRAGETVTFGFLKPGLVFYPGAACAGHITVADIGFAQAPLPENCLYTYTAKDLEKLPFRAGNTNKGSCGKIVIAAGSENMGGAACLSAAAAYRSGCGLVRVFTHERNRIPVLNHVPEAVLETYEDGVKTGSESLKQLEKICQWADCIVLGPGLSTGTFSEQMMQTVLAHRGHALLVLDADALNLLAQKQKLWEQLKSRAQQNPPHRVVLTPHMGEMARLMQKEIGDIADEPVRYAQELARTFSGICILKDAATVVTDGSQTYVNTSGNCGMSTAGAGDVLTGVLAGMLTSGFEEIQDAAAMAVFVHGLAGDYCRGQLGVYGIKAMDIAEAIPQVLHKNIPADSRYTFTNPC